MGGVTRRLWAGSGVTVSVGSDTLSSWRGHRHTPSVGAFGQARSLAQSCAPDSQVRGPGQWLQGHFLSVL